jgi:sulfopyruvate decarboxylase subunit alpha
VTASSPAAAFPATFVEALREHGFDFFAGVPCSLVKGIIRELEAGGDYVSETREDAALGLAAGAYLGGRLPAVVMQNSGLGVSLNALASLHRVYAMSCLLLITWRGHDGQDAPEHNILGPETRRLLDLMGIAHRAPDTQEALVDAVGWAARATVETRQPVAIIVRPGMGA